VNIVWLPSAIDDLERLKAFLAERTETSLGEVSTLLRDASRSLANFPERCRRVPGRNNFRELLVETRSQTYVMQFRIAGQSVVIVRVWHSKESR
jgi:toxin ParE1/3/4